ncbi:30S ribosome-binding factor RbfA [bacterium]|nr:30S ribosome-binding factor RbfA [bacterium]
MPKKRNLQVRELLKIEISHILRTRVKDPRIGFVSITNINLSNDLRQAKVYFSIMGTEEEQKKSFEGLKNAQSYIQKEVAHRIRLRYAPTLSFFMDTRFTEYDQIEKLFHDIDLDRNDPSESLDM